MIVRRFTDEEMVNLHVLLRYYCGRFGITFKAFSFDLANALEQDADARQHTFEAINNFLNKGSIKAMERLVSHLIPVLNNVFEQAAVQGHVEFELLLVALIDGEIEQDQEAIAFFDPARRSEFMAGALQSRLELKDPRLALLRAVDGNYDKRISQALGLFAYMVEDQGRETNNVSDPRLQNRHFVAIRRWSREPGGFSVHGLKFWQHDIRNRFMYFSEKYRIRTGEDGDQDRENNGICFFDGSYLQGIARGRTSPMMTMLAGVLPEGDTFDSFRGILTTSNRTGERISAHVLCLVCEDVDEKHRRMGHFKLPELLDAAPENQRGLIEGWALRDGSLEPTVL